MEKKISSHIKLVLHKNQKKQFNSFPVKRNVFSLDGNTYKEIHYVPTAKQWDSFNQTKIIQIPT